MSVVAAVDPSPAAQTVVQRALEQAQAKQADLHLVHVFQPPAAVYPMQGMYLVDDEEMEKAQHELVWNEVSSLLAEIPVTRAELRGYPATGIVDYAKEVGADLIVIGTRGRGGFASLMLGSTSQAVIHDATCDVLVVMTNPDE